MTTKQVSCRVPADVAQALQEVASRSERSLSWVASKALQQFVRDQKSKEKK